MSADALLRVVAVLVVAAVAALGLLLLLDKPDPADHWLLRLASSGLVVGPFFACVVIALCGAVGVT